MYYSLLSIAEPADTIASMEHKLAEESVHNGVNSLELHYLEDQPFSVNASMAAVLALRSMPEVLMTGRDVHILGEHSIEFTANLLTGIANEKDSRYSALLDELDKLQTKQSREDLQSFLLLYKQGICSFFEQRSQWTFEERLAIRQNLNPGTSALRTLFGRYVDGVLDESRLLHEGGELDGIDKSIYNEFVDPFYLEAPNKDADRTEKGLTGHTRMKLLLDARTLGKLMLHDD